MKLIADIGGTHARFACCDATGTITAHWQARVAEFPGIEAAIEHYLHHHRTPVPITAAALAIAAPLAGDEVRMTNHPWRFSIDALRRQQRWQRLIVLNDFTALAMSLRQLPMTELQQLGGTTGAPDAPIALLGPGTGLGVSGLLPLRLGTDVHWLPLQGEGGHVSCAPGNAREAQVLAYLWQTHAHVSAERVLSGPGLVTLYQAVCGLAGVAPRPLPAEQVTARALAGTCPHCAEALALFCALLGSVAGNLALTLGARQAVYLGGGIVPQLGDYLQRSAFRARFEAKGRYADYLAPVPVFVIHTSRPTLLGLAQSFTAPGPRVEVSA